MSKSNRKKLLINPNFQVRVIAQIIGITLVLLTVFYLAVAYFTSSLNAYAAKLNIPHNSSYFKFVENQEQNLQFIFIGVCIISILLTAIFGLIITHRIAGPLYRLQKSFDDMEDGKFKEIHFREDDFFPEVADSINSFHRKSQ